MEGVMKTTKAFWAAIATMSPRLRASPWTKTGNASEAEFEKFSMGEACLGATMKTNYIY